MINMEWMTITSHKKIASNIFELTLQGELVGNMNEPGQFVHIKLSKGIEPLLRRPISICSINHSQSQFTIVFRAEGFGTKLLSEKGIGDKVHVLGPLGNGFPVHETNVQETALLVGGGIGVPPLYELSKQLVKRGVNVIHVLGFQSAEQVFYESKFHQLGDTYVATVDGTYGIKGFVTNVITEKHITFDTLYACGPNPMLRALEMRYPEQNVYLSLEERMGCGIGACFACVCKVPNDDTGYAYKKVCTDGPVFKIGEVVI
ncbi:dihydroorotate dehydrogenase electron transfer subunit [Bacillus suaedaesalsae]|uniref:Dihydroorotate dehydrogenase B (NAD(+)), electron transfer subunit n=1 Tax=Bacillus suaedaesalsae TaxID=2810349 RepID=A0ABS2DJ75_9BACI|nr:dihydroorotate dehydrogenase electron transfer subunit [Bacillus suaedaesalsae]MBM6618518.1 dihydroorotate dehydrogenase electron transfer subunit [Bacillus suaedaesalsae]